MRTWTGGMALAALISVGPLAAADGGDGGPNCKEIHADLVEDFSTEGCAPPSTACYLGEVDGNQGLRGTTRFDADSGAAGPPTSPGFISYSGKFEYFTDRGTLIMRETGVTNTTQGNPESGAVTAFQKVVDATGELAGATGHFFVSGFETGGPGGHVVTKVTGVLCQP